MAGPVVVIRVGHQPVLRFVGFQPRVIDILRRGSFVAARQRESSGHAPPGTARHASPTERGNAGYPGSRRRRRGRYVRRHVFGRQTEIVLRQRIEVRAPARIPLQPSGFAWRAAPVRPRQNRRDGVGRQWHRVRVVLSCTATSTLPSAPNWTCRRGWRRRPRHGYPAACRSGSAGSPARRPGCRDQIASPPRPRCRAAVGSRPGYRPRLFGVR